MTHDKRRLESRFRKRFSEITDCNFCLRGGGLFRSGMQQSGVGKMESGYQFSRPFDRTNIWQSYCTGGLVLLPTGSKFGLDLGAGLGLAVYANRKGDVGFKEDGFSLMANINANYRISKIVGAGCGIQFARDFLATETAPELENFFKNSNIFYLSAGLVFYIDQ